MEQVSFRKLAEIGHSKSHNSSDFRASANLQEPPDVN